MFAGFSLHEFPIVYISIKSDEFSDENLELYQNSFIQLLLKAKDEKQKIIILLDLFECDGSTFNMDNLMKQANFYKSIMKYTALYIQHVYILSNRNDLHFFVKIFRTFGKSEVPYKIVKTTEKIEQNIQKKYNIKVELNMFKESNINKSELIINYIYEKSKENEIIINKEDLENINFVNISEEENKEEDSKEENENENCLA